MDINELHFDLFLAYTSNRRLVDWDTHWCMIPSMHDFDRSGSDAETFITQAVDRLEEV